MHSVWIALALVVALFWSLAWNKIIKFCYQFGTNVMRSYSFQIHLPQSARYVVIPVFLLSMTKRVIVYGMRKLILVTRGTLGSKVSNPLLL